MKRILPILIAIITGLIVLGGYFFADTLSPLLNMIVDWGLLLIGTTGLIGIGYLLKKHVSIVVKKERSSFLSIVLLAAFLISIVTGLVTSIRSTLFSDLMINVQIPVETSLLAILAVVLMTAGFRLITTRGWTPMSIAFLTSAVVTLGLNIIVFHLQSDSSGALVINFLRRLPLVGARGILLGMALGGMIVGLRVLLTIDKPYGKK